MTKMEFALAVEQYYRKRQRDKWQYLAIAVLCSVIAVCAPLLSQTSLPELFTNNTVLFAVISGLSFAKYFTLQFVGQHEDPLLIEAMKLLETESAKS